MGVYDEDLAPGQHQRVHRGVAMCARTLADHLVDVVQVHRVGAPGAADQAVDIALAQQHGADQRQATTHLDLGQLLSHALARGQLVVGLPEVAVAVILLDVDDVVVQALAQAQAELLDPLRDDGGATDQRRTRQALVDHHLAGAQDALLFALGVGDALVLGPLGDRVDRLHHGAGGEHEALQLLAVGVHVGDRTLRDAAVKRRLCHRRRDLDHQARIEGLGDQVLGSEG